MTGALSDSESPGTFTARAHAGGVTADRNLASAEETYTLTSETVPALVPRPVLTVGLLLGWVAIGWMTAYIMKRRGHDPRPFLALGIAFGPLLIPYAMGVVRNRESKIRPLLLAEGSHGSGPVDLLIGLLGPAESVADVLPVIDLMGSRIGRVTLCALVDFDSAQSDDWADAKRASAVELELAAAIVGGSRSPTTVLVPGGTPQAFFRYAEVTGHQLVALTDWSGTSIGALASLDLPVTVVLPRTAAHP